MPIYCNNIGNIETLNSLLDYHAKESNSGVGYDLLSYVNSHYVSVHIGDIYLTTDSKQAMPNTLSVPLVSKMAFFYMFSV